MCRGIGEGGRNILAEPVMDLPLPRPTKAAPGTEEKIRVLAQRFARGQQLWHPNDEDCHDRVSVITSSAWRSDGAEPLILCNDEAGEVPQIWVNEE